VSVLIAILACTGAQAAPVATVAAGTGLAEWGHVEAGWLPREDLALELHAGVVVFNVVVGPFVTWRALGQPRGHQLLITGGGRLNPGLRPVRLHSGGETLAATAESYVGYGFVGERGLLLRVRWGALLYADDGFAAAPNFGVSVGAAFGQ
jgi:hypothetical protein